jgi:hypothetical protein
MITEPSHRQHCHKCRECQDREALGLLQVMLTATGNPDTDQELNALFARPVSQRLAN